MALQSASGVYWRVFVAFHFPRSMAACALTRGSSLARQPPALPSAPWLCFADSLGPVLLRVPLIRRIRCLAGRMR